MVAAPGREVAPSDPRCSPVASRTELGEAPVGFAEHRLRLVEPPLLEQRASEHELGVADLVEIVDATVEQLERVTRLLLSLVEVAGAEMDLGERRDGAAGVSVPAGLESDRERLLQQADGVVGVAEEEVETAEVVRELADVDAIRELGVRLTRALRVRAGENPVALAVGDERSLDVRGTDRPQIVDATRELESRLDVVAGCFVVALAAPAARAPGKDVRLERVAREPGPVGERERLVQQAERRLDAVQLVAAGAEPEQDVGALDVGERLRLGDRPRVREKSERGAVVAHAHLREARAEQRTELQLGDP